VCYFIDLCHAYCLMTNHYHLLIETQNPTLSKGMKSINGRYTQGFNKRHERVGHVFQGRFKAILVESDAYLLEMAREWFTARVNGPGVVIKQRQEWSRAMRA